MFNATLETLKEASPHEYARQVNLMRKEKPDEADLREQLHQAKLEIARYKLFEIHPELKGNNKAIKGVIELLKASGYQDYEISKITDHRFVSIVYQAYKAGVR
ncbi:hypothetical protein G6M86_20890 [Agrobacterium tumefaciens]|uniref:Uncharacterized protein n=1 Tax=Agrobacterium tumefaciens TaxID=358 RepID=A0AAJ4TC55_AGRTU|nr:hypothetical protein G6M86_20890 [Agrobacterium tumefaciens]